ncbi:hypothetical protein ZIOFF_033001 [Zingiber officinale]|uniref:nucleoside-diphosphate kinase n=1 Tax=Zingiber officinale TaxID=94328 RepID=A0A8J5L6S0_ZINOF|nr:hypothetical protein ZIOFF_033001 [Zingiber officinale]
MYSTASLCLTEDAEGSNSFSPAGLCSSISAPLFVAHAIAPAAFGDPAVGHPTDGDAAHTEDAQPLASPMRKVVVSIRCQQIDWLLFEKKGFYLKGEDFTNYNSFLFSPSTLEKKREIFLVIFVRRSGLKLLGVERSFAEKHYADLSAKPFFDSLVEYIISGPVVAMMRYIYNLKALIIKSMMLPSNMLITMLIEGRMMDKSTADVASDGYHKYKGKRPQREPVHGKKAPEEARSREKAQREPIYRKRPRGAHLWENAPKGVRLWEKVLEGAWLWEKALEGAQHWISILGHSLVMSVTSTPLPDMALRRVVNEDKDEEEREEVRLPPDDTTQLLEGMAQLFEQYVGNANRGGQQDIYVQFRRIDLKDFSGTTDPLMVEGWIRSLEVIFRYMNIADAERVCCTIYLLKDDASLWWEGAERGGCHFVPLIDNDAAKKRRHFLDGLRPTIRRDILLTNPTVYNDAVNGAYRAEHSLKDIAWEM